MFWREIDFKSLVFGRATGRGINYEPECVDLGNRMWMVKSETLGGVSYTVRFKVIYSATKGRQIFAQCGCPSGHNVCKHVAIAALMQYRKARDEQKNSH